MRHWVLSIAFSLTAAVTSAGEVTVAVASNFLTTAEKVVAEFEAATSHQVVLTHGSTGQLHAQIANGAPFDVFLAGDAARPKLLEDAGIAQETRPYAFGQLVLASKLPLNRATISANIADKVVALADPTVAPYGLAATRAMEGLALDTATFKPVLVSNVGQVGAVFVTGNADAAFVAAAQVPFLNTTHVLDLEGLYGDIQQDAALLRRENVAADAFWKWLFAEDTRALIAQSGYRLPAE